MPNYNVVPRFLEPQISLNNTTVDHYNAVIVNAQEYYPFGMLMPGRGGQIGTGRNIAGNIIKNGDTIPATLTVTQRTNNLPATYMATEAISFEGEFASGTADEFTTLMVDQSNADAGSDNGVSYGIAGKGYRYGFNGKENDNEVKGEGNQIDYGFRIQDSRLGRFLSVDPLTQSYPYYTPYQFAGNKPIVAIDLEGLEEYIVYQFYTKNNLSKIEIMRYTDVNGQVQDNHMIRLSDKHMITGKVLIFNHRENSSVPEVVESDQLSAAQKSVLDQTMTVRSFDYKNGGRESFSNEEYKGNEFTTGNYIKSSGIIPPVITPTQNVKPKFPKPIIIDGHKVKENEEISMNVFFEAKKAEPVDFNKAEDAAFNIAKQISGTKIKVVIKAYVLIEVNATLDNLVPETNITYRELVKKRADYMVHRLIQNGVKQSQIITVTPGKSEHKVQKITATFRP